MDEPTLLFGIGATKSGTSWLYHYLSGHPECHFRAVKELHYFDALQDNGGNWAQWRARNMKRKLTLLQARQTTGQTQPALRRRIDDLAEWQATFDGVSAVDAAYLAFLADGRSRDARLIGDITPFYSGLDGACFQKMAGMASKTRFVFLLRDPLDRTWSNIRMTAQRAALRGGDIADHAARLTNRFLRGENERLDTRSGYIGTLEHLTASVPKSQVFFEFFERLFTDGAVRRLTEFLGISPKAGNFSKVRHQGTPLDMDAGQQAALLAKLRPQYEYVRNFFGGEIPGLWQDRLAQSQLVKV